MKPKIAKESDALYLSSFFDSQKQIYHLFTPFESKSLEDELHYMDKIELSHNDLSNKQNKIHALITNIELKASRCTESIIYLKKELRKNLSDLDDRKKGFKLFTGMMKTKVSEEIKQILFAGLLNNDMPKAGIIEQSLFAEEKFFTRMFEKKAKKEIFKI